MLANKFRLAGLSEQSVILVMMFVPLSHEVLRKLQAKGYNVLKSVSLWGDENPTWRPAKIESDISEYLLRMELQGKMAPNQHFLVISEGLNIPEDQLSGNVLNGYMHED